MGYEVDPTAGSHIYDPTRVIIDDASAPGGRREVVLEEVSISEVWSSGLIGSAAPAGQLFDLFAYGLNDPNVPTVGGSTTATKATKRYTNLRHKGTMPSNEAFAIYDICVEFPPGIALATLITLMDSLVYRFVVGTEDTPILELHARSVPGGSGGVAGFTTANNTSFYQIGKPQGDSYYPLRGQDVIVVRPMAQYRVGVENGDTAYTLAVADVLMRMKLHVKWVRGK